MKIKLVESQWEDFAKRLCRFMNEECPTWECAVRKETTVECDRYIVEIAGPTRGQTEYIKGYAAGYYKGIVEAAFERGVRY